MKKLYFLVAMVFFFGVFTPAPVFAQENATHVSRQLRVLKIVFNDSLVEMPDGAPPTWTFLEADGCTIVFIRPDSAGTPQLYREGCNLTLGSRFLGRTRVIDIRDFPLRVLFVGAEAHIHDVSGNLLERGCHVWVDREFWGDDESDTRFRSFGEAYCGENYDRLQKLLARLMPTIDQP